MGLCLHPNWHPYCCCCCCCWVASVMSDSATPWTAAYQAPPSMGLCRQEYWSGVPLPSLSWWCLHVFLIVKVNTWMWKRIKKQAADTNSAIQVDGNIDAVWWRLPGENKMKSVPHRLCSGSLRVWEPVSSSSGKPVTKVMSEYWGM